MATQQIRVAVVVRDRDHERAVPIAVQLAETLEREQGLEISDEELTRQALEAGD